jgi:hypothetical protein
MDHGLWTTNLQVLLDDSPWSIVHGDIKIIQQNNYGLWTIDYGLLMFEFF